MFRCHRVERVIARMVISSWDNLTETQRRMAGVAGQLWKERDNDGIGVVHCGQIIKSGFYAGKQCKNPAGQGTWYEGYGRCVAHGGAKRAGRILGAWLMAHAFAQEYDLTPWEALLYVVRITAGRVRYCEFVLSQAASDREIEGRVSEGEPTGVSESGELVEGRNLRWWVETSERERMMLARVSKAAIDAGVAQLMIEKEIQSGEQMAMVLGRTLDALDDAGIPNEVLSTIRSIMGQELRNMDGGGDKDERRMKVIEGGTG